LFERVREDVLAIQAEPVVEPEQVLEELAGLVLPAEDFYFF